MTTTFFPFLFASLFVYTGNNTYQSAMTETGKIEYDKTPINSYVKDTVEDYKILKLLPVGYTLTKRQINYTIRDVNLNANKDNILIKYVIHLE